MANWLAISVGIIDDRLRRYNLRPSLKISLSPLLWETGVICKDAPNIVRNFCCIDMQFLLCRLYEERPKTSEQGGGKADDQ